MLLEVVGPLLPSAAGIALSPFPIVAVILVVTSPRARSAGPAFAAGWVVGLGALTAVAVGIGELVGSGQPATWAAGGRVVLGAALVVLGVRTFDGRPGGDEPAAPPAWLAQVDTVSPARAVVLGLGLAALNPKNFLFAVASASAIGQVDQDAVSTVAEAVVFVVLASSTVLGAVLVSLFGGDGGRRALASTKDRLLTHSDVIIAVVLWLIGAKILGDGLAGLG